MTFENADYSFENQSGAPPVTGVQPASGSTVVVRPHTRYLYVNPPAGIAALTIQLPRTPENNQFLDIGFGEPVAALNFIDGAGAPVPNMPTAGAAGVSTVLRYLPKLPNQGGPWVKWR